jgi:hypothetical protein
MAGLSMFEYPGYPTIHHGTMHYWWGAGPVQCLLVIDAFVLVRQVILNRAAPLQLLMYPSLIPHAVPF